MRDPAIFKELAALASQTPSARKYAGGNALTMAQRSALEGARHILLAAQVDDDARDQLHPTIKIVGDLPEIDVHLALEYGSTDVIAGIPSKRTNRYYLNSDIHNARLTARASLQNAMQNLGAGWIFTVTGLQLLDIVRLTILERFSGNHKSKTCLNSYVEPI